MESKHTSGPWKVVHGKNTSARTIVADGEKWVGYAYGTRLGVDTVEQVEANAHLIAAAPDMFEVIKELYEYSMSTGHKGVLFPKVEAAYLKATGQQIIPTENQ